jgi:dysferlin
MIRVKMVLQFSISVCRVFQFHTVIPDVKDLKVQVIDNDYGNDDLIGETLVDLENRLISRHHATSGLPPTYNT